MKIIDDIRLFIRKGIDILNSRLDIVQPLRVVGQAVAAGTGNRDDLFRSVLNIFAGISYSHIV